MKRLLIPLFCTALALAATGCRSTKDTTQSLTERVAVVHDTLRLVSRRADTLWVRDSVAVGPDSLPVYRQRTVLRTRWRTDTVRVAVRDTARVTRHRRQTAVQKPAWPLPGSLTALMLAVCAAALLRRARKE